ncbi:MAG: hypothetical protein QXF05_01775 [Thermofilaceae archaeon]
MESLRRLFGYASEEDPLKREIEEMRKAAKAAVKEAERREKQARKAGRGARSLLPGRRGSGEAGGLSRAVEEMESIFIDIS